MCCAFEPEILITLVLADDKEEEEEEEEEEEDDDDDDDVGISNGLMWLGVRVATGNSLLFELLRST